MSYPGNATLTREMQQRILSTFKQTLTAAAAGNRQEATLGCDFILRLDSLFGPARQLLERLEVGEGPVDTADLAAAIGLAAEPPAEAPATPAATPDPATAAAAAAAAQPPDIDDLSDLDLEMGLSDPAADAPAPAPAQPEVPAAPAVAQPAPPAAPQAPPATPPAPPATPTEPATEVDGMDDLDLGLDETPPAPEPEPEPFAVEPPPIEAPPIAPPPPVPAPPAEAPAPETPAIEVPQVEPPPIEAPPIEAPPVEPPPLEAPEPVTAEVEAPPEVPDLPDVPDVPDVPEVPDIPEVPEAPVDAAVDAAVEAPAPPAAEPVAEAPTAPEAPGLDDLDDLDLSAEAAAPPVATPAPDEAAAEAAPEPAPVEGEEATGQPAPAEGQEAAGEAAVEEAPAAPATAAEEPPPAEADTPAPTGETTEEPAPAEEATAPPPPESVEIPLDTEPAAQLDSESQQRIADLLAEGQEAFDGGEYQGAIDAWSRIFLIDIDHAEANKRIEEARKLKAEADRKVEEKFHEGLAHLEGGDTDAAAESFRDVLEMQSSHLQARNYLEKLEAGEVPVPAELPKPADAEQLDGDPEALGLDGEGVGEGDEEPKAKPERGTKAVGERVVTVRKSPFKSVRFMAIAAVGLVAVLGGAWYLFQNFEKYFPNSAQEEPAPTAQDPVARAQGLHDEGKTPIAIAQLRRLPPDSPQYDEAQALIAQWELEQAPVTTGPEGPSEQELARREALIADAGAAAENREFMRTSELLSEAATIAPLSGAEVQLLASADEQLQELQNFITIFREGEWDLALRDLWLLHETDPGNNDVKRLLVDSYYNLGLRALQRKDLKVASEQFKEALGLSPNDPELLRLADFASTYQIRSTDLLYRIYVKYHPFR